MWMNGRYTYDAIASMIPSIQLLKPREPFPYTKEPYPLTKKEYEERMEREEKRKQEDDGICQNTIVKESQRRGKAKWLIT